MIVISDTSAISSLFLIGRLDLLQKIYLEILIPNAVMDELLVLEKQGINLSPITSAEWIKVVSVNNDDVNKLLLQIDLGEAEAIILAKELNADWLVIDETKGRAVAQQLGLPIIGLLGILAIAKEKGIIYNCRQILDELITKAKFRVREDIRQKFLERVGE